MVKPLDITGMRFGRLVATRRVGPSSQGVVWLCTCDCGQSVQAPVGRLRSGNTKSCGCLHRDTSAQRGRDSATHGMFGTVEYTTWSGMLSRCLNPNAPHYADYGGRGITVCERWREFSNFYADMGAKPPGLTLERIDNDKGYSPENCRWATREEQARNRRSNRLITYEGVTATLAETARRVGMGVTTLRGRLDAGWSVEEAITKPSRKWRTKEQACSI